MFWILRAGAPWRDLPPDYMADGATRTAVLSAGATRASGNDYWSDSFDAPDFEWLLIDASHIKVHPHAAGDGGR